MRPALRGALAMAALLAAVQAAAPAAAHTAVGYSTACTVGYLYPLPVPNGWVLLVGLHLYPSDPGPVAHVDARVGVGTTCVSVGVQTPV